MNYLLDTNICVYWLKGYENIEAKAMEVGLVSLSISFITLSELYYGAYKSQKIKKNIHNIEKLKKKLYVIESSEAVCELFGRIKVSLKDKGNIIDDADIFIAACTLAEDVTLVTNNEKHFERIEGLRIENWL
ncbi:MAG: type II toxin-antitoxin system VapC family toxin [Candidatus Methanoperedens sp.]|nr:type II toxin-antitoxin system VapC family toxin [Candidatus Methanoperedens sp.]